MITTSEEQKQIREVFDTYSEMPWASQHKLGKRTLANKGLAERCKKLLDANAVYDYMLWVDDHMRSLEKKLHKRYIRQFATAVAEPFVEDYFSEQLAFEDAYNGL